MLKTSDTQALGPLCGLYGGTFDPIHFGHLNTVTSVMDITGLDSVRFIPSAIPPHRSQPEASANQRLEMVQIAVQPEPRFIVDDRELKRSTASYTVDTIHSLRHENLGSRYALILGMDAFLGLPTWHEWETLLELVHIIVMQRPGWRLPESQNGAENLWWQSRKADTFAQLQSTKAGRIHLVQIDPIDISATNIRNRLKQGLDVSGLMPLEVQKYISANRLYVNQPNDA